jgi:ribosome-binding factor A
MNSNHRRRGARRPHDLAGSTPGFDPHTPNNERKLRQLCRQVHERVDLVLAGELADPNLDGLWVLEVAPEPGGAALLITLVAPDHAELAAIRASLDVARGHLRSEVAAAIHRKKTPNLRFAVIPETALRPPGKGGADA